MQTVAVSVIGRLRPDTEFLQVGTRSSIMDTLPREQIAILKVTRWRFGSKWRL